MGEVMQQIGGGLFIAGILTLVGSRFLPNFPYGVWTAVFLMGIGGMLFYFTIQKWYCAACGQVTGRGDKPSKCGRCGSNRMTTEDPGVER